LPLQQPTELFILISTRKYLLLSRPLITFASKNVYRKVTDVVGYW
jgi:hypothetical protein